jgi:hypothetical protein
VRGEPTARCEGCGFTCYGATAADGLRALGQCIRCGGKIAFAKDVSPPRDERIDPRLGPHQVLGAPRTEF